MTKIDQETIPHLSMTIGHFLNVGVDDRDDDWLKAALQAAVELEMATIPPYLCAYWSIKDHNKESCQEAARILLGIAIDEMYHMAVMCNVLVGVGGVPDIRSRYPKYPGRLPRGVIDSLTIELQHLTKDYVKKTFMVIEKPTDTVPMKKSSQGYPSIGKFYEAIQNHLKDNQTPIRNTRRQVAHKFQAVQELKPVTTWEQAFDAIEVVKEEGEGTSSNPKDKRAGLAHYYAFGELAHGKRLVPMIGEKKWTYGGDPVDFPADKDVYQMGKIPKDGWPSLDAVMKTKVDNFRREYGAMLSDLHDTWSTTNKLNGSIKKMHSLSCLARDLMKSGCGPDFRPLPAA